MLLLYACLFLFTLAFADSANVGIINGTDVNIADYPWMVSVYVEIDGYILFICGGALISQDWVLTAGHCTEDGLAKIRAGSSKLDDDKGTFVDILEIVAHPNFTYKPDGSAINDLALLRLNSSVDGTNINPVKLPEFNKPVPEGSSINITGWGDTTGRGNDPNDLQGATLVIPVLKTCVEAYEELHYTVNEEGEFCAGTIGDTKGTCRGDSGSPAEINGTLYGVVSWGYQACSTSRMPVVLANVAKYRNWINDVTGI